MEKYCALYKYSGSNPDSFNGRFFLELDLFPLVKNCVYRRLALNGYEFTSLNM